MKPLSLRSRLVLGSVGLVAVGLTIANVAGLTLFATFQVEQVDRQLAAAFGADPSAEVRSSLGRLCEAGAEAGAVQIPTSIGVLIADRDGQVTCAVGMPDPIPDLDPQRLAAAADTQDNVLLRHEHAPPAWRGRVLTLDDGYAVLTRSLAETDEAARRLVTIGLTVGSAILLVVTVAGFAVVHLGLRPLARIQDTAEQIAAGDLSRRVEVSAPRTEVGRLGTSLNAMLAQIEGAFAERDRTEERLRRFVADASHELRTPLATIRGHAELVRTGVAVTPDEVARMLGRIESESIRMTSLVDDLLLLARLDSTRVIVRQPVDLLSVAVDAVADTRARAPEREITVRSLTEPPWDDASPAVLGDGARLHQVATNLLSNAVQHTPAGTAIEVRVGVRTGGVELRVVDHGPGIHEGNEERVFERFFREDAGRSRQQGGAGLGLAIAWTLVDRHDGTLRHEPTPGGGSTFVVTLPAADWAREPG